MDKTNLQFLNSISIEFNWPLLYRYILTLKNIQYRHSQYRNWTEILFFPAPGSIKVLKFWAIENLVFFQDWKLLSAMFYISSLPNKPFNLADIETPFPLIRNSNLESSIYLNYSRSSISQPSWKDSCERTQKVNFKVL